MNREDSSGMFVNSQGTGTIIVIRKGTFYVFLSLEGTVIMFCQ